MNNINYDLLEVDSTISFVIFFNEQVKECKHSSIPHTSVCMSYESGGSLTGCIFELDGLPVLTFMPL